MPVRLKPATPRSRVKNSTTEPLRSLSVMIELSKMIKLLCHGRGIEMSVMVELTVRLEVSVTVELNWQ